jgi:sarcosine oxidase subunit alpha
MTPTDIAIVGGGPAGLCAALTATKLGARVTLIDDNDRLGGQLVKQTHKFFGSRSHYCGTRGTDIATLLESELRTTATDLYLATSVVGLYDGNVLALASRERFTKLRFRCLIVTTGATENSILFENNDLPGVYGAGAIQTLMNVSGVKPGSRILMVGSGNVGLIVSYQLMQAGMEVAALVEALPRTGGYHVHAAKLARLGVPILTSHTITRAIGRARVEAAVICRLDAAFRPIRGTERTLKVDTICLAAGLTPLSEILWQAGCHMVYVPDLGGHVAWHNQNMQTSLCHVYLAGDVSGIEEASAAMLEGRVAGAHAAAQVIGLSGEAERVIAEAQVELCQIRQGPFGDKAACGKARLAECAPLPAEQLP